MLSYNPPKTELRRGPKNGGHPTGPQFESQTKVKLTNPEIEGVVGTVVYEELCDYLERHPDVAKAVIQKAVIEASVREDAIPEVQRRGVGMEKFLQARDASTGKLPVYRVKLDGQERFFYTQEALAEFIKKEEASRNVEVRLNFSDLEEAPKEGAVDAQGSEFHDVAGIEPAMRGLEALGLSASEYFRAPDVEGKARFRVVCEGEGMPAHSIREALRALRKMGQKGLDVQRYKGLGEMNPEQLWETTMNPETRTLLKVTLEDALMADRIFSILMGEEVEPRRDFIEKHALEVKYLDV